MFQSLTEGFHWIESFTNLEKEPDKQKRFYRLERMFALLELFDSPEKDFRSIHIAGSKGKGSTAVLIAGALKEAGFRTGLYTSPHIQVYQERIRINLEIPDDKVYLDQINRIYSILENKQYDYSLPGGDSPTTFELLTLLGFLIFSAQKCEWAVIETGLGGRLDATNTLIPECTVITPIELEHTKWLGETLEKVAFEKGGIIKEGIPLVISRQSPEVFQVLSDIAAKKNARLLRGSQHYEVGECQVSLTGTRGKLTSMRSGISYSVQLKLIGDIQLRNMVTAMTVLVNLFPDESPEPWIRGFSNAILPGRMQVLMESPVIITDGAHTPNSFDISITNFSKLIRENQDKILLFGCGDDKDADTMAKMSGSFSRIYITTPGFFKKMDPRKTAEIFRKHCKNITLIENPSEAFKTIRRNFPETPILVCGSFFLSGEIINLLENSGEIS